VREIFTYMLLGLGTGAMYTTLAHGLVVQYRGSGVLNFSYAATGVAGAYVTWDVTMQHGQAYWYGFAAGVGVSVLLSAATYFCVIRPLRGASTLARLLGTLAVLLIVQALILLRYTAETQIQANGLPRNLVRVGPTNVSADRLILTALAIAMTIVLWALYKHSTFGALTSAVAENPVALAALGRSSNVIGAINWIFGGALSGVACILIAPTSSLQSGLTVSLLMAGLAAAVLGGFSSFGLTLLAGLVIGVAQSVATKFISAPGVSQSLPFLFIVVVMVVRGTSIPIRGFMADRLPRLGSGRVRWPFLVPIVAVCAVLTFVLPGTWTAAAGTSLCVAIILLSAVLVTGMAGQLSLAQFGLAGLGGYIAARLEINAGLPFLVDLVIAAVVMIPIGALFAWPAIRTRGVTLAVVTLGLAQALHYILFSDPRYTGGYDGMTLREPSLFGWSIENSRYPGRYALVCLILLTLVSLFVSRLRRGAVGRVFIAIRDNERAAAALGISVPKAKCLAFSLSAGIASIGGTLVVFASESAVFVNFDAFSSANIVILATIGGIGYVLGAIPGSTLAAGGIGAIIAQYLFARVESYLALIAGVVLLALLLQHPDGAVSLWEKAATRIARRRQRGPYAPALTWDGAVTDDVRFAAEPGMLAVEGLTVRYGGVTAVKNVSFDLRPGEVLGLMGPNGAGKTSVIDAVTGLAAHSDGSISLNGRDVGSLATWDRQRRGLARSFQGLELFDDLTVLDNLLVASATHSVAGYARSTVGSDGSTLSSRMSRIIETFSLSPYLLELPESLPYGTRRMVGIARAIAGRPAVLLLDEPAAGLSSPETLELSGIVRQLADEHRLAILVIEHDIGFLMRTCDRITVLSNGEQIATGTPQEVRTAPQVVSAYLGKDEVEFDAPAAGGSIRPNLGPLPEIHAPQAT
jgi:ABC-type branched-subunit amino acid transport system ATPase component/ABC-type branched-subunit amino acid transport system permease subunit